MTQNGASSNRCYRHTQGERHEPRAGFERIKGEARIGTGACRRIVGESSC